MRTVFLTLLFAILFNGLNPAAGQTADRRRSEPVAGIIAVKFTPEALPTIKSAIAPQDLDVRSNAPLRRQLPFSEGRKIFRDFRPSDTVATARTGAPVRLIDLSRWYLLKVPDTTRVTALAERLEKLPQVEAAAPQIPLYPSVVMPNDPEFQNGDQWNLDDPTYDADIDAPEAWELHKGRSDVTVAILDGGVDYNHTDLDPGDRSRVIPGADVADDDGDAIDDIPSGEGFAGHGTLVAGVAGAITNNNRDIAGVMWNTQIMPVKIAYTDGPWWDPFGWTQGSAFHPVSAEGVDYARQNGADIINMSFGSPDYPGNIERFFIGNPLGEAVQNAYLQGLVVVSSSGNDSQDQVGFPATSTGVISVGNTTITDSRYSTSNYGPTLDLVAPGTDYPSTKRGGGVDQDVFGTSFSAPMVAGVAGLILSESRDRNLGLTNDDIQHLMEQTADDLGPSGRDDEYGHGRVNAHKALQALQPPNTVTHASATGGSATKVDNDFHQVFVNSGSGNWLASGHYWIDLYEVTGYVTFDSVYAEPPLVWPRERQTVGWSGANPNGETAYAEITNVTTTGFDYKTYTYWVESEVQGQQIDAYYPAPPSQVKVAYTVVGEAVGPRPPSVTISGPTTLNDGQQGTWTAHPAYGTGSYSYQWYYKTSGTSPWQGPAATTPSYSHTFYNNTGGPIMAGVKVEVTSGGDMTSATQSVQVACGTDGALICPAAMQATPALPEVFALEASYPNPTSGEATIRYALPEASEVELVVHNVRGQRVATLALGSEPAGFHEVALDASEWPSGVYLYRLTAGTFTATKRLVVVK